MRRAVLLACLIAACAPARADAPRDAQAIGPAAALECVAARYRGEALRIRDKEDGLVQELRWLTPAGNVLEIEMTGPGCRFLEVEGVGQTEARILPGQRP
jgi:hypothetical protein